METPYNYPNLESRFIMIYLVYPYFAPICLGNPLYFLDAYRNIPRPFSLWLSRGFLFMFVAYVHILGAQI